MKNKLRWEPAERIEQLTAKGYEMAHADGLESVNRVQLGRACGVTDGLVSKYFHNAHGMYLAIIARAVRENDVDVVADGYEMGLLHVSHVAMPDDLREEAKEEAERRLAEKRKVEEGVRIELERLSEEASKARELRRQNRGTRRGVAAS